MFASDNDSYNNDNRKIGIGKARFSAQCLSDNYVRSARYGFLNLRAYIASLNTAPARQKRLKLIE